MWRGTQTKPHKGFWNTWALKGPLDKRADPWTRTSPRYSGKGGYNSTASWIKSRLPVIGSSSLSHDSTVVQRPSTIDTAVHLGPEFFTPSYGHNSMSFGPRNDFLPLTGPVYPLTVRTGTLDYEAPADLTGHARNQSVHYCPQTDQSLPIHHSYSVNLYARLGDG